MRTLCGSVYGAPQRRDHREVSRAEVIAAEQSRELLVEARSVEGLVPGAAVAVPVAVSLAAIAWLHQAARGRLGEGVWLYLGAVLALLTVPISRSIPVAVVEVLLAVLVSALVVREVLTQGAVTVVETTT